jgi:hypothetical protein
MPCPGNSREKRKVEDEAAADAAVGIYRIMCTRVYQNAETQTPSSKASQARIEK